MAIQKLRLQRGWSQQQLAELSGLSVRTIQRLEAGQTTATAETLKSLAAVFEMDFSTLKQPMESEMQSSSSLSETHSQSAQAITQSPSLGAERSSSCMRESAHPLMQSLSLEEKMAFKRMRKLRGFYTHLMIYVIVCSMLLMINYVIYPSNKPWAFTVPLYWGIGLLAHAFGTFARFSIYSPDWERRTVEKYLGRKL